MIATEETKYKKGESVKIKRGGNGVVVDVFEPPSYLDEPKYAVGFADGMLFTYQESDLEPLPAREKNGLKHGNGHVSKVEELKRLWKKDKFKLISKFDREVMAWIADYLCEYEILTTAERDELYQYIGLEV